MRAGDVCVGGAWGTSLRGWLRPRSTASASRGLGWGTGSLDLMAEVLGVREPPRIPSPQVERRGRAGAQTARAVGVAEVLPGRRARASAWGWFPATSPTRASPAWASSRTWPLLPQGSPNGGGSSRFRGAMETEDEADGSLGEVVGFVSQGGGLGSRTPLSETESSSSECVGFPAGLLSWETVYGKPAPMLKLLSATPVSATP